MKNPIKDVTPIYVVSGGKGVTGHIIVQTLIIQYPENKLEAKIIPDVGHLVFWEKPKEFQQHLEESIQDFIE